MDKPKSAADCADNILAILSSKPAAKKYFTVHIDFVQIVNRFGKSGCGVLD